MPYIPEEDRNAIKTWQPSSPGELAYELTKSVLDFLEGEAEPRFYEYAEALGALEAVKLELYRRMIAPYEDKKIEENGDVFP